MSAATPTATSSSRRINQRGSSVILFTMLSILLLIPLLGLAVDASVMYLMKAKLSSAVDAAAIATARSLNLSTSPTQQGPAEIVGKTFFYAN